MKPGDRQEYVDRYTKRLETHGYSPETLGWGKNGRQDVRFAVLGEPAWLAPDSSVLDAGCGFADLFDFLTARGWRGKYTGIDIVPGLLDVARQRHPALDLKLGDIEEAARTLPQHDYVIASGLFNARLAEGKNEEHILSSLKGMHSLARVCVCVDFLSTHVDYVKPDLWNTSPEWALSAAMGFTRRVQLRHDYIPYEFALFVYSDATVSERQVFAKMEESLSAKLRP